MAARKAKAKHVSADSARDSARRAEARQALTDLRANSSWVCMAPGGMDDRDRLLPDRSKRNQTQAPGRGRAGTSAALNQSAVPMAKKAKKSKRKDKWADAPDRVPPPAPPGFLCTCGAGLTSPSQQDDHNHDVHLLGAADTRE